MIGSIEQATCWSLADAAELYDDSREVKRFADKCAASLSGSSGSGSGRDAIQLAAEVASRLLALLPLTTPTHLSLRSCHWHPVAVLAWVCEVCGVPDERWPSPSPSVLVAVASSLVENRIACWSSEFPVLASARATRFESLPQTLTSKSLHALPVKPARRRWRATEITATAPTTERSRDRRHVFRPKGWWIAVADDGTSVHLETESKVRVTRKQFLHEVLGLPG